MKISLKCRSGVLGKAIAICHWNPYTYRLRGECAGKLALPQVGVNQLYLAMPKPCVLLLDKEVGWFWWEVRNVSLNTQHTTWHRITLANVD